MNAQAVVVLPLLSRQVRSDLPQSPASELSGNMAKGGALVVCANKAKVFKFSDLARFKAIAQVFRTTNS